MSLITLAEAQAWGEKTKLLPALSELDTDLLAQLEAETLAQVATVADTSTWSDSSTTPSLVKTILARNYVAWIIDRQYSEDEDLSNYSALLRTGAMLLLTGIMSSAIDIPGVITDSAGDGLPSIYPTDDTVDRYGNPYGPYFTMDAVF